MEAAPGFGLAGLKQIDVDQVLQNAQDLLNKLQQDVHSGHAEVVWLTPSNVHLGEGFMGCGSHRRCAVDVAFAVELYVGFEDISRVDGTGPPGEGSGQHTEAVELGFEWRPTP